jgi:kumamolisin
MDYICHSSKKDKLYEKLQKKGYTVEKLVNGVYITNVDNKDKLKAYCKKFGKLFGGNKLNNSFKSLHRVIDVTETDRAPAVRTAKWMSQYYGFPSQNGTAPTIAIISLGGTYLNSDLNYYWNTVLEYPGSPKVTYVNVAGSTNAPNQPITNNNEGASGENTLDIEIASGICPEANIIVYFAPNSLLGFYMAISSAISGPAKIISISWGISEPNLGSYNTNVFNQLFATAISKGKTVCVASGDNGSTDGYSNTKLAVNYPGSSPYVVSCGGTSIGTTETAWSWNSTYGWGGGGGLSQYTKSLSYTSGVVSIPSNTKPSISNIKKNRSLPDISGCADPATGWAIYFNGKLYLGFGGTSCVSPMISGYLGLCNLNYTGGFLNKLYSVYKNSAYRSQSFKDITSGSINNVKNGKGVWDCRTGYDQCTGMGSIKGTQLYNILRQ